MTKETEELLNCTYELRQRLSSVLPQDAVEYIVKLIVLDSAHQKFLALTAD